MDNLHIRLTFNLGKTKEIFFLQLEEASQRLVEFANLVWGVVKYGKCSLTKHKRNVQTLRGYIFHVLQHFATKLGSSTNFGMLFLAVVEDFVRLAWIQG